MNTNRIKVVVMLLLWGSFCWASENSIIPHASYLIYKKDGVQESFLDSSITSVEYYDKNGHCLTFLSHTTGKTAEHYTSLLDDTGEKPFPVKCTLELISGLSVPVVSPHNKTICQVNKIRERQEITFYDRYGHSIKKYTYQDGGVFLENFVWVPLTELPELDLSNIQGSVRSLAFALKDRNQLLEELITKLSFHNNEQGQEFLHKAPSSMKALRYALEQHDSTFCIGYFKQLAAYSQAVCDDVTQESDYTLERLRYVERGLRTVLNGLYISVPELQLDVDQEVSQTLTILYGFHKDSCISKKYFKFL